MGRQESAGISPRRYRGGGLRVRRSPLGAALRWVASTSSVWTWHFREVNAVPAHMPPRKRRHHPALSGPLRPAGHRAVAWWMATAALGVARRRTAHVAACRSARRRRRPPPDDPPRAGRASSCASPAAMRPSPRSWRRSPRACAPRCSSTSTCARFIAGAVRSRCCVPPRSYASAAPARDDALRGPRRDDRAAARRRRRGRRAMTRIALLGPHCRTERRLRAFPEPARIAEVGVAACACSGSAPRRRPSCVSRATSPPDGSISSGSSATPRRVPLPALSRSCARSPGSRDRRRLARVAARARRRRARRRALARRLAACVAVARSGALVRALARVPLPRAGAAASRAYDAAAARPGAPIAS